MPRLTQLFALLAGIMLAGCESPSIDTGKTQQAIIECNGGIVGLACDSDDDPCTLEVCAQVGQNVECTLQALAADGTPCLSDGLACTADTCQAGVCENTPLPVDTLCNDGLFCTSGTVCDAAGVCGGGGASCDDNNACTADSCDEDANQCGNTQLARGADCDDGDACTDTSTCSAAGECIGADVVICDDGSACTADSCDPVLGCIATILENSPCSDDFFCTIAEACTIDGNCEGAANCGDSNPCTVDTCDELGASCDNTITPGALCEDDNACTESDSCDALGVCDGTAVANGTSCGSAGGCLAGGTCANGTCIGGTPLPDATTCDDNNACTITDVCTGGNCGGYPRNCFDGDPCTADGCDEVTGCFNLAIEGCSVGPDAGVPDAGPDGDGGIGDDAGAGRDAGLGPDAGPEGILGGGGCNSAGPAGAGASVLILLLLMLLRRRAAPWLLTTIAFAVATHFSYSVQAQGFDSEIFRPGSSSTAYLSQQSAQILPAGTINMGVSLNVANDPLVLHDPVSGDRIMNGEVVSSRRGAYLVAGVGLLGRFEVGLALPMVLSQDGRGMLLENSPDLSSASLGDLRLAAKARLWGGENLTLAASLAGTVPAGDNEALYGEPGFSASPELIVGWNRGRTSVAINLGMHFRETSSLGALEIGNELTAGAGAQVELSPRVWLLVESYARSPLSNATAENAPAEALLGVRAKIWGPYQVQAAAGLGIGRGYGAPASRGLLGLFYRPQGERATVRPAPMPEPAVADVVEEVPAPPLPVDSDGDGIVDSEDDCPEAPEDMDGFADDDGCPDLDNDQDGIADVDDACPLRAEVVNGIDDQDGCPDEGIITMVEDRVVLGETVLFDKNRSRVKRKGREALRAIIALYLQHPEWGSMSVEGHADSRGPADSNMDLSRRRADRVRHTMIDLGMPAAKITSQGFGETVPLVEGESDEAMQTNRRVEFVIRNVHKEVKAHIIDPGLATP